MKWNIEDIGFFVVIGGLYAALFAVIVTGYLDTKQRQETLRETIITMRVLAEKNLEGEAKKLANQLEKINADK